MKLTKYEHACVVLEEQDKKLIIDPGNFTKDFGDLHDVAAIVITHIHPDHFYPEHISAIMGTSPGIPLFTTPEVATAWKTGIATVVKAGDEHTAGPFTLRFYGEMHAEIHPSVPRQQNTGVMVNDTFYYPGDSLTVPNQPVAVLALPAAAPWLKASEAMDFMAAVKPSQRCFRTHDTHLSERGLASIDNWLTQIAQTATIHYRPLAPGESFEF